MILIAVLNVQSVLEQLMNHELLIETILGLAISAFWFYARNLSEKLAASDKAHQNLTTQLHQVELTYQSRADAVRENEQIMGLLREIRAELKEMNEKLNQKADK